MRLGQCFAAPARCLCFRYGSWYGSRLCIRRPKPVGSDPCRTTPPYRFLEASRFSFICSDSFVTRPPYAAAMTKGFYPPRRICRSHRRARPLGNRDRGRLFLERRRLTLESPFRPPCLSLTTLGPSKINVERQQDFRSQPLVCMRQGRLDSVGTARGVMLVFAATPCEGGTLIPFRASSGNENDRSRDRCVPVR